MHAATNYERTHYTHVAEAINLGGNITQTKTCSDYRLDKYLTLFSNFIKLTGRITQLPRRTCKDACMGKCGQVGG